MPANGGAGVAFVDTVPQRGATLKSEPKQVVLHFSETVEGNFGAVRVFDAKAKRVDAGNSFHPAAAAPLTISVSSVVMAACLARL